MLESGLALQEAMQGYDKRINESASGSDAMWRDFCDFLDKWADYVGGVRTLQQMYMDYLEQLDESICKKPAKKLNEEVWVEPSDWRQWKVGDSVRYAYVDFDGQGVEECKVVSVEDDHAIISPIDPSMSDLKYWIDDLDVNSKPFPFTNKSKAQHEAIQRKPARKLTEANADEPLFQAFITNLGKYNEGELVGEWCAFPIDEDDFEALLKKIGIDGREYEEWFVTDYECQLKGFNWQDLGEYPSYDDLQEVGETLENIDDIEKFDNVYEAIGDFKYAVETYDDAWFVPDISDYDDLGLYYIEEAYGYNIPSDLIERYFDFEALGRDLGFDNYADMYDEEELAQMYENGDIENDDYVSAGEYLGLGSNASDYDIGEEYVSQVGIDGINDAHNYFDYEKFGRDLAYDGAFTSDGFVFTN